MSVVIPTYNRLRLVTEAVRSVLAQEGFDEYEIVVVDDGSTDGTAEALRAMNAGRLRVVEIAHSGLPGFARNRGVERSRGRYVAFLDSDDVWKPRKLAVQTAFLDARPEQDIVHTREVWLRNGKEVSQKGQRHTRSGDVFRDSLVKCVLGPSTVMMRRRLYVETGGFREDLEIAEDYEYWLRITAARPVGYIDEPLTVKRAGHGDQLTDKYGHIEYFRIAALRDLVDQGIFTGERRSAAVAELARKCRIYAAGARKRGRTDEADVYEATADHYEGGAGGGVHR